MYLSRRNYTTAVSGLLLSSAVGASAAEAESGSRERSERFPNWEVFEFRPNHSAGIKSVGTRGEQVGKGVPFGSSVSLTFEMGQSSSVTVAHNIRNQNRYDTVTINETDLMVERVTPGGRDLLTQQSFEQHDTTGVVRLRLGWDDAGNVTATMENGGVAYECRYSGQPVTTMGESDSIELWGSSETKLRIAEASRPKSPGLTPRDGSVSLNQKLRRLEDQHGSINLRFKQSSLVVSAGSEEREVEFTKLDDRLAVVDWEGDSHVVSDPQRAEAIREAELNRMRAKFKEAN